MIATVRFAASPALLPVVIPCAGVERYRPRDRYDDRRRDDYDRRSRGGYGFDDRRAPRGRSRSPRDRYDDRR